MNTQYLFDSFCKDLEGLALSASSEMIKGGADFDTLAVCSYGSKHEQAFPETCDVDLDGSLGIGFFGSRL